MTDLQHVPMHIRCSGRHLIDENYPLDGTLWWKAETERSVPQGNKGNRTPAELTELHISVREYLREQGVVTASEVGEAFNIATGKVHQIMGTLSVQELIFEGVEKGELTYGLLEKDW